MKKILMIIGIITCLVVMTGIDFRSLYSPAKYQVKKNCFGYTIIEAGKGLDCNGDTVVLKKNHGYYELVTNQVKNNSKQGLLN